jgi:hypothetical protein
MSNIRPVRKPYPSDVRDEEWAFVAPYLLLLDRAHEAGHAVISIVEGRRLKRIVMERTGYASNAHIEPFSFPGADIHPFGFALEEAAISSVARDRLRRQMHILLAGGEADRLALPDHFHDTDGNDLQKASTLLARARTADLRRSRPNSICMLRRRGSSWRRIAQLSTWWLLHCATTGNSPMKTSARSCSRRQPPGSMSQMDGEWPELRKGERSVDYAPQFRYLASLHWVVFTL